MANQLLYNSMPSVYIYYIGAYTFFRRFVDFDGFSSLLLSDSSTYGFVEVHNSEPTEKNSTQRTFIRRRTHIMRRDLSDRWLNAANDETFQAKKGKYASTFNIPFDCRVHWVCFCVCACRMEKRRWKRCNSTTATKKEEYIKYQSTVYHRIVCRSISPCILLDSLSFGLKN